MIFISQVPFLFLILDRSIISNFWFKIANISGFLGTVFLIWQFILGVRGFSKRITTDYDWIIKIHTFLGINGALFVLIHPFLEKLVYKRELDFLFGLNFSNQFEISLTFGKIAFFLFLFVWFSSSLIRKTLKYRLWLYIHYLSYPMLIFVMIHPIKIGTYLNSIPLLFYYWIALCLLSLVIFIFKIGDVSNLSNFKAKLLENKSYPGDIFTLKYKIPDIKKINIKPGQYFYIKNKFISEAHPFSVLEYDLDSQEITFGIKKLGRFSENLSKSEINEVHYLDGPFGEFTLEGQNSQPKVILAGGIGITPFYELLSQFTTPESYLFFANKNIESALYRSKFKEILGKNYYDFIVDKVEDDKNIFCELISSKRISEILKNQVNNYKFFICGSPNFTNSMISCLIELGVNKNSIYIEEFEY